MYHLGKISYLTFPIHLLFIVILLLEVFLDLRVDCLSFTYPSFTKENENDFITTDHSYIAFNAIQVTGDARGASITNLSGRIWYSQPLNLWNRKKNITTSFNSTFVINIKPESDPSGEELAFILTKESGPDSIPNNSYGQWLGIVNASTNGSSTSNIFAVEFDTRKSYLDDLDDNHVGIDINSINPVNQVSLTDRGVNLSRAIDVIASVRYDGESKILKVYTFMTNQTGDNERNPIISMPLDLSSFLSEDVLVGFSASTGIYNQLNCIKAWNFTSTEIGNDHKVSLLWLWILIPIISVLVIFLGGVCLYFISRKKKERMQVLDQDENIEIQIQNSANAPQRFQLKDLKRATGNFDPKNILGRGGCGVVFKGLLADHNKEVAVKKFFKDSSQGAKDLIAEVTTIGNLHHKNLVKLIGWCYESNELLVVYEFMPNGSLDRLIFCEEKGEIRGRLRLNWERRHGIICGIAQALDYLHNGCQKRVLHRDIKASNIMLDSEFNAQLGDFGLARTVQVNGKTHHSTKEIAGTIGYMAPESFHIGRATVETDVFAFGVLVLEVACGRKPGKQNEENGYSNRVIECVWDMYKIGRIIDAIDVKLEREFDEEQAECVLILGLACCHPNPYERPSMKTALQILTGESVLPNIPTERPAFVWPVRAQSTNKAAGDSLQEGQLTQITVLSGR
ncbi:LOW QUALITY PROTEIN: probable L-type lectin-domain containing receptor kinase S.5 [Lycium ferocissimum]|uniref:LOW QUALITY PROTEIN: probable L-type lectin-domain containing receptor kinase S.5 n=1 Tax=Lycium ferocissimum TaxID=112874 RepID=UPI002814B516|nr:LOW QUALITY PROTEIN: probable L-type lectin-domain containing receptor kinase S.5 [Lycium ferocissimum]